MSRPAWSVVIPTRNEGDYLGMTVASVLAADPSCEVVVVDDGSTDGSVAGVAGLDPRVRVIPGAGGVSQSRNAGAAAARGRMIVFLDAHCTVPAGWLERFAAALRPADIALVGPAFSRLEQPEPRGCGMTWCDHTMTTAWFEPPSPRRPREVPLTPGGCQAFVRDRFITLGGYDEGFATWGYEDVEISLRGWLLGGRVRVDSAVTVAHYFRDERGFSVADVDVAANCLRLVHLHFAPPRIRRVLRALGSVPGLGDALDRVYASDVFHARLRLEAARVRDDGWFARRLVPALA